MFQAVCVDAQHDESMCSHCCCRVFREQKDPLYLRDKLSQKHSKEQFEAAQKMEQEYSRFFTGWWKWLVFSGTLQKVAQTPKSQSLFGALEALELSKWTDWDTDRWYDEVSLRCWTPQLKGQFTRRRKKKSHLALESVHADRCSCIRCVFNMSCLYLPEIQ